jgi:RNA polymerase sigma factor (sigma-70 family)
MYEIGTRPDDHLLVRVMRLERPLRVYLRKKLGNPDHAEELLKEIYVRISLVSAQSAKRIACLQTFVLKVARELLRDGVARRPTPHAHSARTAPGENCFTPQVAVQSTNPTETADVAFLAYRADLEPELSERDYVARLIEAARTLPNERQRVFVLRKVYGWKQARIAKHLNLSEKKVEKHLTAAALLCNDVLFDLNEDTSVSEPPLKALDSPPTTETH